MQNSNKSHIAVIDCAINDMALDPFNQMAKTYGRSLTYHIPAFMGMDTLLNDSKARGYVILGSASSVNDRLEWQIGLEEFILKRLHDKVPVLGICFGHQLVARAFGATVRPATESGLGFEGSRQVSVNEKGQSLGLNSSYEFVVLHNEEVKNVPDGFEVLGTSSDCQVDMIQHLELPYMGVQGHPEANRAFIQTEFKDPSKLDSLTRAFESGTAYLEKVFQGHFKN